MLREGDTTYNQQCDVIFKPKHLQLQALSMTFDDKSFFVSIYEKLMEILLPLFETN
jgi:hypothetical protein